MAVTGRGRKFKAWLRKPRLSGQVNQALRRTENFGATEDSGSVAFLDWIQVAADTPAASNALDDGGGWWGSIQSAAVGVAVAAATSMAAGNAQSQTIKHQDEVPYVTGNGVRYSQPYTQRVQVKPVFIQMGGGDELPVSAAPSFVDDTTAPVIFPKIEIPLPAPVWDDPQLCRILVEENEWGNPFVVPQIIVAPTFGHQDEYPTAAAPTFPPSEEDWSFQNLSKDSVDGIIWVTDDDIAPAFAVEEIGWKAEWLVPKPFTEVFWTTDEIPTAAAQPQGGGGVVYDEISIFRWYQEDPLPILAATLGIDEEPWKAPVTSLEGPKWLDSSDELIVPQPAPTIREDDYWIGCPTFLPEAIRAVWDSQDEVLPSIRDEEPWVGPSYPSGPFTGTFTFSDDIVPQPPSEINVEETYWLQPDPPRDVVTSWQFSLEVNEDFPELSTPPVPPRVEILGGDPTPKRKKHRKEVISELVDEVVRERNSPPPKPVAETKVLVPSKTLVVVPELKPVIQVLPIEAPKPPADLSDDEIYALYLLGVL